MKNAKKPADPWKKKKEHCFDLHQLSNFMILFDVVAIVSRFLGE
jgi:hypothetical protein